MTELENGRPQNCGAIPTRRKRLSLLPGTRSVQKLFGHSEYLQNGSHRLRVTWQPVKGDITAHSPVESVSRQWDAVDWVCVLCDRRIHDDWASRSASSQQCTFPFHSSHAGFFDKTLHHSGLSAPLQPTFGSLRLLAFPKAKITIEREEICECDGHTTQAQSMASHCQLTSPTGEWLFTYEQ